MKRPRKHVVRRREEAVRQASLKLLLGKRLEVEGPAGRVFYLGTSRENRRDPFWLEHSGGRTYYERHEEPVERLLPHVGILESRARDASEPERSHRVTNEGTVKR
jgi:hypothetical protein